ncbi:hypothetical protein ACH5RR_019543 [Cinchona calisaya]|uniref:RING-type E3 ubiquitin transferase n=1 Tax=Cinchona calisaya TaxID=153742 RepID=A0ABD2ZPU7_9GENT
MEEKITQVEEQNTLMPPTSAVVAVAISGGRKSKYVIQWALEKFVPEGEVFFKLLHVRPKIIGVPTPMGNLIPISQVREDVATAFRKDMEWQASKKLLPYEKMCTRQKVQVEIVQVESDDVANAIAEEVVKYNINKLVIGASSRRLFSRGPDLSSKISECTPSSCTVYAVSKAKLAVRPSDSENSSTKQECSDTSSSSSNFSSTNSSSRAEWTDQSWTASYSHLSPPPLPLQRFQALSTINQGVIHRRTSTDDTVYQRISSINVWERDDDTNSSLSSSEVTDVYTAGSSFRSLEQDDIQMTHQTSTANTSTHLSSGKQINIDFELEKLRIEIRHLRGMYAVAQNEAMDASRKLNDLNKRRLEDTIKLKEISLQEKEAKELAKQQKERYEASKREADYMKECAEREAAHKREAEAKALREAKEKEKLENALVGRVDQYKKFTWEEIVSATSSFSEDLRVGMGAYGTVYKCSLHYTTAAVKILHSKDSNRTKQFQQELEILSKIRHPHLLILLGACPEHGCLVYEFMKNGSLEERLLRKNNSPPLPWFERCRIAWEVASAIVFLHNSKPKAIIHRDLKPANILLDDNFVSKIGDVGLSTMLHSDPSLSTAYKDTGPVGTFCYIDPEYQRTGLLSPRSDIYAFGIVILQLLTAKPPMGLVHEVEKAIENDSLMDVLDQGAGEWPIEETKELVMLALRCTELRGEDRPDMKDQVLPALEKLKEIADRARDLAPTAQPPPPNMFICPILKELMDDPCVAADGYTYDRKAIEEWLEKNDTSPMTNLQLPHKNLLPNYTLLSAIMEWKTRKH